MKYFLSGIPQGVLAGAFVTAAVFFFLIRETPSMPQSVIFDDIALDVQAPVAADFDADYYDPDKLQQLWSLFRLVMKAVSSCAGCDEKELQGISPYFSKKGWERFLEKWKADALRIEVFSSWPQVILSPEEVDGVTCMVLMLDYNSPQQSGEEARNSPAYRIKMFLRLDGMRTGSGALPLVEDIRWEKVTYGRK